MNGYNWFGFMEEKMWNDVELGQDFYGVNIG